MDQPRLIFQPGVPAMSPRHGSLGWSSVGIVVADDGLHLLDTGGPGYRPLWDDWLAELGATRRDVTTVLLTHSHWDHVGSALWFDQARYVLSADEYSWAIGAGADNPYVDTTTVSQLYATGRLEIAGDGDRVGPVEILETAGHTPGHVSFAVTSDQIRWVFAGDALKDAGEVATGTFAITEDPAASETSRQRLLDEHAAGARLLLGHAAVHPSDDPLRVPVTAKQPLHLVVTQP